MCAGNTAHDTLLDLAQQGTVTTHSTRALPVGVLLAAGLGSRFRAAPGADPTAEKLMQQLPDGRLVAVASAQALRAALPKVVAVVRADLPVLADALAACGCELVTVPGGLVDDGMGDNLARGVRATTDANGWVVALADMPWLKTLTIERVAQAVRNNMHAIAAPLNRGRRGHPVAFGASHGMALAALTGDAGARDVLRAHAAQVRLIEVDDAGVLDDVDTPADLARRR